MLRDGESGLGVEDDDEPKRSPEKRIYFPGLGHSGLNRAGRLTVESSGAPYAIQPILEARKHNLVALYLSYRRPLHDSRRKEGE